MCCLFRFDLCAFVGVKGGVVAVTGQHDVRHFAVGGVIEEDVAGIDGSALGFVDGGGVGVDDPLRCEVVVWELDVLPVDGGGMDGGGGARVRAVLLPKLPVASMERTVVRASVRLIWETSAALSATDSIRSTLSRCTWSGH